MDGVENSTPRPLYLRGRDPFPTVRRLGGHQGPVWTGAENLALPPGLKSPDHPAPGKSLYWAISGHNLCVQQQIIRKQTQLHVPHLWRQQIRYFRQKWHTTSFPTHLPVQQRAALRCLPLLSPTLTGRHESSAIPRFPSFCWWKFHNLFPSADTSQSVQLGCSITSIPKTGIYSTGPKSGQTAVLGKGHSSFSRQTDWYP